MDSAVDVITYVKQTQNCNSKKFFKRIPEKLCLLFVQGNRKGNKQTFSNRPVVVLKKIKSRYKLLHYSLNLKTCFYVFEMEPSTTVPFSMARGNLN